MSWNRFVTAIGGLTILIFLGATLTPMINIASRFVAVTEDLKPADAIVVLGAGMMSDGSLSQESVQRLLHGITLHKQGMAPILILSGPAQGNRPPEAASRADLAIQLGIPPAAIRQIVDVDTTRDEAYRSADLLVRDGNKKRVLLVTEPLHLRRAKLIFEAAGLTVYPAPSDNFPAAAFAPVERLFLFKGLVFQSAGLLYYRLAGFI